MPHTKSLIEKLCEIAIHVGLPESEPTIANVIKGLRKAKCNQCDILANELSLLQEQERKEPLLNSRCADCHELVGSNAAHICKSKTVTEMAKEAGENMSKHKIRANKVFDFVVRHKTLIYQTTRFYGNFTSGKHDSKLHELIELARKEIGYSDATWSGDIFNSLVKQYKSITIDGNNEPCLHPAKNLHGLNGVYYCDQCRESFSFLDTIPVDQSDMREEIKDINFIKWYSGMDEQKIRNAFKRYQKEVLNNE